MMLRRNARKIILIAAAAVFLFSSAKVLMHRFDMHISAEYAGEIVQTAVVPHEEETQIAEKKNAPIQVDFDALKEQNGDIVAWIYCEDTPINYPVVQAEDNKYYLQRLFDGRSNSAGTLFVDYRNRADLSDWNWVVYGHNMNNGSMFACLPKYKDQAYFEAHPEMYLLTPGQDYVIRLFAGFVTPLDAELYDALSPDESKRMALVEEWISASDFDAGYRPAVENQMITLSTCTYEYSGARYVLIGTLEKIGDTK